MAVSLIPVLIILAAALLLVVGVVRVSQQQDRRKADAERPTAPTLRYLVPEGQDPVAVLTALRREGYEAVTEDELVLVTVLVDSQEERARVRAVIEEAGINIENHSSPGNPVRFADE